MLGIRARAVAGSKCDLGMEREKDCIRVVRLNFIGFVILLVFNLPICFRFHSHIRAVSIHLYLVLCLYILK